MTTITATVDRIQAKAVDVNGVRLLLALLALPFFVAGYIAYGTYRVGQLVASWLWAAVIVGWETAGERGRGTG
ncbi:MAG: hypothetical protein ACRDSF_00520 [Pseudonocardiaceae bacterium]